MSIPLYKGYENPEQKIIALWLDYRLRIEALENFHVHWGDDGCERIELTKEELLDWCDAFDAVNLEKSV